MASAAIWLDELGIPPREVCLDWAWQIQSQFASTWHSSSERAIALSWQHIEVGEGGKLLLPLELKRYSPEARLKELIAWTQGEYSGNVDLQQSTTSTSDLESKLRILTASCFGNRPLLTDWSPQSSPTEPVDTAAANQLESSAPSGLQFKVGKSVKLSSQNSTFLQQLMAVLKQHKVTASLLAAGVLIVGSYFVLSGGTAKAIRPTSKVLSHKAEEPPADNSAKSILPDLDDGAVLATITEMPELDIDAIDERPVSPISMPSISSDAISGIDNKRQTRIDSPKEELKGDGVTTTNAEVSSANPISMPESSNLTNQDVMHELDVAMKSAENKALESDLSVPDSTGANGMSEPLVLQTSPMVQVHKLAAKVKVRPRQPVWQIQLAVDDEFELTPQDPQDITDGQIATWALSNADSKSPKARLVIQAQAASGRQTALRWRVFASAEDQPDLMLPLDKEILNPLQDRLRVYSQMSQREADRLKQLASTAEREVRTVLSKQRAILESQSKLSSRLLTIVAESQLLDDLLRSQLTVYAKLRDGVASDGPVLLQIGDSSSRQKQVEEANPTETAK